MPNHFEIYQSEAEKYDLMVSREDYEGNLLPALQNIAPLDGLIVAEFGAGTGRLTRQLAPVVKHIYAYDQSQHMLDVAKRKLTQSGFANWQTAVADHRQVDLDDNTADLAISAWSICYLVQRNDNSWQTEVPKALAEMKRVLRPGGTTIILETMGDGENPSPPEHLIPYFRYLESQGFQHTTIRTDCLFKNLEEAEAVLRFFSNDAKIDEKIQVTAHGAILPEHTGIWWHS